ncbi:bifunctional DNA primase/polymerase [Streptomyces lavendulae]|uniref:bifunctional DNA primase/polymerase n=1 Tax=Streptomyces lavendulae TaxID=1914 RepID=UPI0033EA3B51
MTADLPPTMAAAVDLVGRGLAVFGLPPGGRRPARPGWQTRVLTHPDHVRRHWRDGDNIGVACRPSRIIGLDLDVDGDGQAVLAALCAGLGEEWPDTLTIATPSGGRHLYFRAPDGCTIASSSGGRTPLGPGIDVRGPGRRTGGYLIGPGSVVASTPYVILHDSPIQELPSWIIRLLTGGPVAQ